MNHVLYVGPYFIFQRPLLLKVMPSFFDFGNEELSKIPVWVKLRNLPLELWNPQALGKILSKIPPYVQTTSLPLRDLFPFLEHWWKLMPP